MSMPLNDMPIDELIRTARNYANCLQPITTYTEIMHELLNRLDAMRVHAKVLANENAAIKCMNDCLAEELQAYQPKGAEMHHVWWRCETPLTNAAIQDNLYPPFAVANGQVFISSCFIQDDNPVWNGVDWAKDCAPAGNSQVIPDFEGVTMTQRECYQAGLEAGKTRRVPDGWISAINKLLNNDGSRGCFDLIESNAAHREIEQLLTDLKGHNEPSND